MFGALDGRTFGWQVTAVLAVGVLWMVYLRSLTPIADRLEQVGQRFPSADQCILYMAAASLPQLQAAMATVTHAATDRSCQERRILTAHQVVRVQGLELATAGAEIVTWAVALTLLYSPTSSTQYR